MSKICSYSSQLKQYSAIFISVMVCLMVVDNNAMAAKKSCKSLLKLNIDTNQKLSKGQLKGHWWGKAKDQYGYAYADWSLATNKKSKCKKVKLRVKRSGQAKTPKYTCSVQAKPCILQTAKKTCKGEIQMGLQAWVAYGEGEQSRASAKAETRRRWRAEVIKEYGEVYADWELARKRDNFCHRGKCFASAQPCKLNR